MEDYGSAAEHEVIESAEALFRHLYEAHGVEEARDLDPDSTPVEPWLRRHAALERAARRRAGGDGERRAATARPGGTPGGAPGGSPGGAPGGGSASGGGDRQRERPATRGARLFDQQRMGRAGGQHPSSPRERRPSPQAPRPAAGESPAAPGARHRPAAPQGGGFTDPLVRALAAELVRAGHDEGAVRRFVRRYVALTPEGGLTGEAGVRASFLQPVIDLIGEQLDPVAGSARPAPAGAPSGTGARPAGEPHGGPAQDAPAADAPSADEVQEDLMAIANVFRRRRAGRPAVR